MIKRPATLGERFEKRAIDRTCQILEETNLTSIDSGIEFAHYFIFFKEAHPVVYRSFLKKIGWENDNGLPFWAGGRATGSLPDEEMIAAYWKALIRACKEHGT